MKLPIVHGFFLIMEDNFSRSPTVHVLSSHFVQDWGNVPTMVSGLLASVRRAARPGTRKVGKWLLTGSLIGTDRMSVCQLPSVLFCLLFLSLLSHPTGFTQAHYLSLPEGIWPSCLVTDNHYITIHTGSLPLHHPMCLKDEQRWTKHKLRLMRSIYIYLIF